MATMHTARLFQANPTDADFPSALQALSMQKVKARTVAKGAGTRLYAIAAPDQNGLGLWTLRQGADIHENGRIKPWDLPSDIAEGSFFQFFDDGVMVMVATGHGPRTTALGSYFFGRTGLDVIFNPVARVDNVVYVTSLDDVKRIEMTLTGEGVQQLRRIDDTLGSAAAAMIDTAGSDKLSLTFDGTDTVSRDAMWARSRAGWVRRLVQALPLPGVNRLHIVIRGGLSGEEDIDVLKDKVAFQMDIPGGHLDLDTAFAITTSAYDRYRDEVG